jgi:DNA (cytosine-5)-methyltransferase 1
MNNINEQVGFFKQTELADWKWKLSDLDNVKKNGKSVFSCFACGGGSTMGYKLAGYDVIGNCEIDKRMNDIYIANHHPKYNYLMDIRDFNKLTDLPDELYNLDILDGSPPCTTFSMAGQREKTWGEEKKFREGQVMQTLDDLSFVFIETVMKLKPKAVIMENVEGILLGNAWQYVQTIYRMFEEIGYHVNHYLLKGECMGVPQTRHRVFFIANRIGKKEIDMSFNYKPITYKEIKDGQGRSLSKNCKTYKLLCDARQGEKDLGMAHQRLYGKRSFFQSEILYDNDVVSTIRAKSNDFFSYEDKKGMSKNDIIHSQTFPEDYKFIPDTYNNISYVCGMSVPPIMIKRIAERIYNEWLSK